MAEYRLLLMDADWVADTIAIDAPDNSTAEAMAVSALKDGDQFVEVWDGDRFITRVTVH